MDTNYEEDVASIMQTYGERCVSRSIEAPTAQILGEWDLRSPFSLERQYARCVPNEPLKRRDRPPTDETPFFRDDLDLFRNSKQAMASAEYALLKVCERCKPWGSVIPKTVIWYISEKPILSMAYLGQPLDFAADCLWEAIDRGAVKLHLPEQLPLIAKKVLQARHGWEYATLNALSIAGPNWAWNRPKIRFSQLDNPFTPIVEIWRSGVLLYSIASKTDPIAHLHLRP